MYSTSAEKGIVEECKRFGATDFIKKHIDTDDLKNEIIKIASLSKTPEQHASLKKDT